jgi:eukaryotic-like serine/threonine-protein kinase
MTAACPPDGDLDRLLADELTPAEEAALEGHVSGCPACQARLDRLTGGPLTVLPPRGATTPGATDTPHPAGVLGRMAELAPIHVRLAGSNHGAALLPPTGGSRFTVLGPQAEGGLGRVHRARDEQLGRTVALKEIRPERADDPHVRRRFLNEAEVTGQLEHPGIVPIYALEHDTGGRPVYAMRLIQGRTLSDAVRAHHERPTALGLRELLQRFISICQTMGYAHSKGVIHRDLKPDNIMLGDYGETLVVDWGLAKRLGDADDSFAVDPVPGGPRPENNGPAGKPAETVLAAAPLAGTGGSVPLTVAGQVMGTPAYMAPEQARGEPLTPAADVYALGAVLFHILTGKVPFQGSSVVDVLLKVAAGERPAVAGAPRALTAICFQAMSPDPALRYPAATDLARDLERWLADEPVGAYREPWPARAGRWARRHRTLVASLGVAAVLLVAGGAGAAWWRARLAEERRIERARNADQIASLLERCEAAIAADDAATARLAAGDAEARAENPGAEHLKERLARDRLAADVLAELDRIDDLRWDTESGKVKGGGRALQEWPEAFARLGVVPGRTPPADAAAMVNGSPARDRLLAALDLWLVYTARENRAVLAAILAAADPDPFRDAFRAAMARWDVDAIKALAGRDEALRQPVGFAIALVSIIELPPARMAMVLGATARTRPRSFAVLMTAGKQYRLNDPATAADRMAWFRGAVTARPASCVAHDNLGIALWDRGDVDGAIAEFRTAIALDPGYATAHSNLAVALSGKGDPDGAIAEYRTAIRLDPNFARAHYNLGNVLTRRGDQNGGIAEYRTALALDPKLVMARVNLGVALQTQGDVAAAVAEFRTAIRIDPKFARAHYNLGIALKEQGELDGAVAAYEEAERLGLKGIDSQRAEAQHWRALLPRLDDVAAGTAMPASAAEALEFSILCQQPFLKRYTASARLYALACAADPKYANDGSTSRRYDAARRAALAGCGQGADAPAESADRAALRRQALAWLRKNQTILASRLASGKPGDRTSVADRLSACLTEKDLAGVRPGAVRDGWEPSEVAAWDAYWADVRALLARATETVGQ